MVAGPGADAFDTAGCLLCCGAQGSEGAQGGVAHDAKDRDVVFAGKLSACRAEVAVEHHVRLADLEGIQQILRAFAGIREVAGLNLLVAAPSFGTHEHLLVTAHHLGAQGREGDERHLAAACFKKFGVLHGAEEGAHGGFREVGEDAVGGETHEVLVERGFFRAAQHVHNFAASVQGA